MRYLVQKFGGTSLANAELRNKVADKIIGARKEGFTPVVVVSAIGRRGDCYATDTLIDFASQEGTIGPRELDLLMSCGEVISGVSMVAVLQARGEKAVFLNGGQAGIITDENYSNAHILEIKPSLIQEYASQGYTVIVAGFQGITKTGQVTTLGRGGSDTTAAALGVALDAEAIDIYTDVDGIMTADPRIVQGAMTIGTVSYNEISNLAHGGARVIHPRAVEIAMQKTIPLRIKSTFSDAPGTVVTAQGAGGSIEINWDRPITGITHIAGVTQLKIDTSGNRKGTDLIFRTMADAEISVDLINVLPEMVLFTVMDKDAASAVKLIEEKGFTAKARPNCAKVSAVGGGMAGVPGIMSAIVSALTEENIQILQSADSHTTIWCLVNGNDMVKAINSLHKKFLQTKDE